MLDQRTNTVSAESVPESFRVIATVRSQLTQVGRIPAGDLRTDLRVVLLCRRAVDVGDVQRFDIHQSGDFQCSNSVGGAVGVMSTCLIIVEACCIDSRVTCAFLG